MKNIPVRRLSRIEERNMAVSTRQVDELTAHEDRDDTDKGQSGATPGDHLQIDGRRLSSRQSDDTGENDDNAEENQHFANRTCTHSYLYLL